MKKMYCRGEFSPAAKCQGMVTSAGKTADMALDVGRESAVDAGHAGATPVGYAPAARPHRDAVRARRLAAFIAIERPLSVSQ